MNSKSSSVMPSRKPNPRTNAVGIWVDEATLIPCSTTHPTAIYFDSYLELRVYQHLINQFGVGGVERQKTIHVAENILSGGKIAWTPDFYIKSCDLYVEAKGLWINQPSCKADKSLFIWQYLVCCELLCKDIEIVSDSAFKIGKLTVKHFSEIA